MSHFHFSIGPVQEFVNQARRTSDFWAGSFLLSWLAGVAMRAVARQGGKIQFPLPPANYLDWIEGKPLNADDQLMARIGAIPNRFSAIVNINGTADFNGQLVCDCVREAWVALANHTLTRDGLTLTNAGHTLWQRQIEAEQGGLWDMHWLLLEEHDLANGFAADTHQHHRLLDLRKHWRSHYPNKEPGRKCSLMHGWQELSGASYNQVEAYWQGQRDAYKKRHPHDNTFLDINKKEHLCALAYVKRRFVQHFGSFALNTSPFGQSLKGWDLPRNVPSTQYLAAVPWLTKVLNDEKTNPAHIRAFEDAAFASGVNDGEARTDLLCVQNAADAYKTRYDTLPKLHTLDGVAFFEDEIRNRTANPASADNDDDDDDNALYNTSPLIDALKVLQKTHGKAAKYYALLLMDGDSIGKILDTAPNELAQALEAFTTQVAPVVQAHSGYVVYAGGDDVLALLPMDQALPCALALRKVYIASFAPYPALLQSSQPSISAAIEFAHYKTPLMQVTNDAHTLLDNVAKQAHGRNSLAVRVWKGSGIHLTWCQPWPIALADGQDKLEMETLLAQFQANPKLFSSGFFFRANEVYRSTQGMGDANAVKELILYEYGHSLAAKNKALPRDVIEKLIDPLYRQSIPYRYHPANPHKAVPDPDPQADAALLLRFLWQKGFEGQQDTDQNSNAPADQHGDTA